MSDNVWTSDAAGASDWFWFSTNTGAVAIDYVVVPQERKPGLFRSTLPIPSAERHHALEELVKAARTEHSGQASSCDICAALARLEETT